MEYIVKKITDSFISNNTIDCDNKEIFEFGLIVALQTFFSTIGLMIIGILLGYAIETIIFIVTFSVIRANAGGHHAKTSIRCFAISITFLVSCLYCVNFLNLNIYLYFLLLILSNLIVILYSPVDSIEKPLSNELKLRCRRRSIITMGIIDIILFISIFINLNHIYINICIFSMFIQCVLMLPILNNERGEY